MLQERSEGSKRGAGRGPDPSHPSQYGPLAAPESFLVLCEHRVQGGLIRNVLLGPADFVCEAWVALARVQASCGPRQGSPPEVKVHDGNEVTRRSVRLVTGLTHKWGCNALSAYGCHRASLGARR